MLFDILTLMYFVLCLPLNMNTVHPEVNQWNPKMYTLHNKQTVEPLEVNQLAVN